MVEPAQIFTSKVWSCYVQRFRRCIYKKIHSMTPRSHKMLPSTVHAPSKFEVVKCNGLGGDTLTRKYVIFKI